VAARRERAAGRDAVIGFFNGASARGWRGLFKGFDEAGYVDGRKVAIPVLETHYPRGTNTQIAFGVDRGNQHRNNKQT
jgi:hypothetical protein